MLKKYLILFLKKDENAAEWYCMCLVLFLIKLVVNITEWSSKLLVIVMVEVLAQEIEEISHLNC